MSAEKRLLIRFNQVTEDGHEPEGPNGLDIVLSTTLDLAQLQSPEALLLGPSIEAAVYQDDGDDMAMYRIHATKGNVFFSDGVGMDENVYSSYARSGPDSFTLQRGARNVRLDFSEGARKLLVTETMNERRDRVAHYRFKGFHPL